MHRPHYPSHSPQQISKPHSVEHLPSRQLQNHPQIGYPNGGALPPTMNYPSADRQQAKPMSPQHQSFSINAGSPTPNGLRLQIDTNMAPQYLSTGRITSPNKPNIIINNGQMASSPTYYSNVSEQRTYFSHGLTSVNSSENVNRTEAIQNNNTINQQSQYHQQQGAVSFHQAGNSPINNQAGSQSMPPYSLPPQQMPPQQMPPQPMPPQPMHYQGHQQQEAQHHLSKQQIHVHETIIQTQIVWQHRFVQIYTKFQVFVEKFEIMIEEVYIIEEQFDSVNDEEGWNQLRSRYAELMNKFNEVREDIITVLEENKKAIENLSPQTLQELQGEEGNNQYEDDHTGQNSRDNVWEHRYYELMQQHDALSQEYGQFREEFEAMASKNVGQASFRPQQNNDNQGQEQEEGQDKGSYEGQNQGKDAELQNKFNLLLSEFQELNENHSKLGEAYTAAVTQLQQQQPEQEWNQDEAQKIIEELEQHAYNSDQKIQFLEEQLRKAREQQGQTPNDQHSNVFQARIEELLEEKNILVANMNEMKQDLQHYDAQLLRKESILEQQSNRIDQLENHIEQMKHISELGDNSLKTELENAVGVINEHERQLEQYRKVIDQRERVIEDIVKNRNEIASENEEIFNKIQQNEKQLVEKIEEIQRLERRIQQYSQFDQNNEKDDRMDPDIFNQRVSIQVESATSDKNRKIKSLTQELDDANAQIEKLVKDKEKSINKIKQFFTEEEESKNKIIHDKDTSLRIMQDKVRSLEHELSNRNLQISRFRHQSSSSNLGNDQVRKLTENLERKNIQIQKARRSYEQKSLEIKEQEQKIESLQHELSSKVFEINTLKREANEFHNIRAEIENANSVVRKKNQQINELRLKSIENQQMEININSLERQKSRLNELIKERSRQCEVKDQSIINLEKKVNSLRMDFGSSTPNVPKIQSFNLFDNTLVKQKQSEIRKLKNQLEIKDTTITTHEKTIKEKQTKVITQQKTNNMLKAQIQNKINRYENEIKGLQKQIKELQKTKEDQGLLIDSMKSKLNSLENSLEQRNLVYDQEIVNYRQKLQGTEQNNTDLMIQKQMSKGITERLEKQNKSLQQKIKQLQDKIESKNKFIGDLKIAFNKKERDDNKDYQQKIKQLNGELKLDAVRIKNMEEVISKVSSKLKEVEGEKKSYRERLLTETSGDRQFDIRMMSEHYDTMPNEVLQMEKFRVKDSNSNNVFERKVIYDLKKENDILKRQLTGMGYSSVSLNRADTQNQLSIYQQEFITEQDRPEEDHQQEQFILYHKNKNKELEERIDELLKVNRELKDKILSLSHNTNNQSSTQFYKEQASQLQSEISHLHLRIKQLLGEKQNSKDEIGESENQRQTLKRNNTELQLKISELKANIRNLEGNRAQLENTKGVLKSQIERLTETIKSLRNQLEESHTKNQTVNEWKRKCEQYEDNIAKLTNKINILSAEAERLNEVIKKKSSQNEEGLSESRNQIWKLKNKISELERERQKLQNNAPQRDSDLRYKLELLRSLYLEIESLIGEIPVKGRSEQQVFQTIRRNITEGLRVIPLV